MLAQLTHRRYPRDVLIYHSMEAHAQDGRNYSTGLSYLIPEETILGLISPTLEINNGEAQHI